MPEIEVLFPPASPDAYLSYVAYGREMEQRVFASPALLEHLRSLQIDMSSEAVRLLSVMATEFSRQAHDAPPDARLAARMMGDSSAWGEAASTLERWHGLGLGRTLEDLGIEPLDGPAERLRQQIPGAIRAAIARANENGLSGSQPSS
ncbi:MAG TPA: hypothetical protein VGB51_06105 [Actinomycetota bacterium]